MDRKTSLSPQIGIGIFPSNERLNQFLLPGNIYAGFTPGLFAGLGLHNHFSDKILIGGDIGLMLASKEYYSLRVLAINGGVKFYPLGNKKRISPYVAIGMNLSIINHLQQPHTLDVVIGANSNLIDFGKPIIIQQRFEDLNLIYGPLIGGYIGAGLDFKIDRKYSLFLQGTFNPTITQYPDAKQYFPESNSFMQYTTVKMGMNIRLMKIKPPEIDTNMIYIPDEIAGIELGEDLDGSGLLVREGVFDVLLREGMKHNVRVSINGHELIIDEEAQDPCKVTCYLYDDKGEILTAAESTPEGKIIFSDLSKGIYDLVFVLEKPCTSANFKYKFPDPSVHPLLQYNSEGNIADSLTYNIEGVIALPDSLDYKFVYNSSALFIAGGEKSDKNFDIEALLANEDGRIIRHFSPGKDEKFSFKGLKPAVYDVVYKVPDVESNTGIKYTVFDSFKKPVKKTDADKTCDSSYNAATSTIKYTMKGKINFLDSLTKPQDVTLYLINCYKKIVNVKQPNEDGTFVFKNLHSKDNYIVYYEVKNPESDIDFVYKIEDPVAYKAVGENAVPKVVTGDMLVWNEQTEYDIKGNIKDPHGFAIQVGATDNVDRVNNICKRLMDDGFHPIAIQVLGTGNLNKKFAFSKSFKLFKVLVGEFPEEKHATREKFKLEFYGYDAYVVKHLD